MQGNIKQTDPDKKYRRILAASSLRSDMVRNPAGEELGKLVEIVIDIPGGRVAYAVLAFGGVLGIGNKLFAAPWRALAVDEDQQCLVLDIDKSALANAPGFDKNNWPDMADIIWGSEIYRFYGASPYWEEFDDPNTMSGGGVV